MKRSRRTLLALALVAVGLAAALTAVVVVPPRGPRSMRQFDAPRMADLELRMWQAY
jgi:hypothetical protein